MRVAIFSAIAGFLAAWTWNAYTARYVVGYAYYCGVLSATPDGLQEADRRRCDLIKKFAEAI